MNSAKAAQIGSQGCARAFASIAMDFAHTVRVIVARPFTWFATGLAVFDRRVPDSDLGFDFSVAQPFVGVEHSRGGFDGSFDHLQASLPVRVMAHEVTYLAAATAFDREDRRAIRFIRAVPAPLVSAPSRWIVRVGMRLAFFPRRSGRAHRPPVRHRATVLSGGSQASCAEFVDAVR